MKKCLAVVLLLSWIAPLCAADVGVEHGQAPFAAIEAVTMAPTVTLPTTTLPTLCPPGDRLSAVSQSDCCKGHKGVCGCRAGKIVCCDNTTSATCTCHADFGAEN